MPQVRHGPYKGQEGDGRVPKAMGHALSTYLEEIFLAKSKLHHVAVLVLLRLSLPIHQHLHDQHRIVER